MIRLETDFEKLIIDKDNKKCINWDVVGINDIYSAFFLEPCTNDVSVEKIDESSKEIIKFFIELLGYEPSLNVTLLKQAAVSTFLMCRETLEELNSEHQKQTTTDNQS